MHTGPAVERDGDWFGATVNLAARVSAAAAGGETLLTETTRTAAGEVEGARARALVIPERRWVDNHVRGGPAGGSQRLWLADRSGVPDGG
jgi:class 3 adenylate cyclase